MKVKELIELLSEFDEDTQVVTSSHHYAWGYSDVSELTSDSLYQNGKIYEASKDDKDSKRGKIPVIILRS